MFLILKIAKNESLCSFIQLRNQGGLNCDQFKKHKPLQNLKHLTA